MNGLRVAVLLVVGITIPACGWAQLAPQNEMGVTMCHLHLSSSDPDASQRFWLMLGGTAAKHGVGPIVKLPGVLMAFAKRNPTGGSEGSIIDDAGFVAQNPLEILKKLEAANIKATMDAKAHGGYFYSPEGVKVEITENPSLPTPIVFDYVQILVAEPVSIPEMQAWYVKTFGAKAGVTDDGMLIDTIPGATLRFTKASAAVSPQGRALDHFGFEIKGLEAFCKKTNAYGGDKPNCEYRYQGEPNNVGITRISYPWGLSIELNEGYESGLKY